MGENRGDSNLSKASQNMIESGQIYAEPLRCFFFSCPILLNAKHCMRFMQVVRVCAALQLALISELWSYLDPVIVNCISPFRRILLFPQQVKPLKSCPQAKRLQTPEGNQWLWAGRTRSAERGSGSAWPQPDCFDEWTVLLSNMDLSNKDYMRRNIYIVSRALFQWFFIHLLKVLHH